MCRLLQELLGANAGPLVEVNVRLMSERCRLYANLINRRTGFELRPAHNLSDCNLPRPTLMAARLGGGNNLADGEEPATSESAGRAARIDDEPVTGPDARPPREHVHVALVPIP